MRPTLKPAALPIATAAAYLLGIATVVGTGWSLWTKTHSSPPRATAPVPKKVVAAPAPVLEPFQLAGEITIIGPGGTTNVLAPPTVLDLNAPLQSFTLETAPPQPAPAPERNGPRVYTTDSTSGGSSSSTFVTPHYYSFDGQVVEAITRLNRGESGNPKWAKRTIVRPLN